ncbi:uncharacterized protein TNCT_176361 [Trichonephila clavata]|uniref:MYND-type domain-containing protein n=1 Tax=Trichonephila clavata TaxID=2740835 RepID=A0A8X6M511_TRICU|nr:uncharacterized protein TNCT_176361 [Trichonephila clavata]
MKQDLDKTETVYFSNFLSKKLSKVPRNVNTVPGGTTATPADPSGKTEYQKKDEENKLVETINVRFDEYRKGIDFKPKTNGYPRLDLNFPNYDDEEDDFDTVRDSLASRLVSKTSTETPTTSFEKPDLSSDNRSLIPCSEVKWIRNIGREVTGSNVYYGIEGTATRLRSFNEIERYCNKNNIHYDPSLFDFRKEDTESQEVNMVEVDIPNCYKQAIRSREASKWHDAMDREINIMKERKDYHYKYQWIPRNPLGNNAYISKKSFSKFFVSEMIEWRKMLKMEDLSRIMEDCCRPCYVLLERPSEEEIHKIISGKRKFATMTEADDKSDQQQKNISQHLLRDASRLNSLKFARYKRSRQHYLYKKLHRSPPDIADFSEYTSEETDMSSGEEFVVNSSSTISKPPRKKKKLPYEVDYEWNPNSDSKSNQNNKHSLPKSKRGLKFNPRRKRIESNSSSSEDDILNYYYDSDHRTKSESDGEHSSNIPNSDIYNPDKIKDANKIDSDIASTSKRKPQKVLNDKSVPKSSDDPPSALLDNDVLSKIMQEMEDYNKKNKIQISKISKSTESIKSDNSLTEPYYVPNVKKRQSRVFRITDEGVTPSLSSVQTILKNMVNAVCSSEKARLASIVESKKKHCKWCEIPLSSKNVNEELCPSCKNIGKISCINSVNKSVKKEKAPTVKVRSGKSKIKNKLLKNLPKYDQQRLVYSGKADKLSVGKGYNHCKSFITPKDLSVPTDIESSLKDTFISNTEKSKLKKKKKIKNDIEQNSTPKIVKKVNLQEQKFKDSLKPIMPISISRIANKSVKKNQKLSATNIDKNLFLMTFPDQNKELEIPPEKTNIKALCDKNVNEDSAISSTTQIQLDSSQNKTKQSVNNVQYGTYLLPPVPTVVVANYAATDAKSGDYYLSSVYYQNEMTRTKNVPQRNENGISVIKSVGLPSMPSIEQLSNLSLVSDLSQVNSLSASNVNIAISENANVSNLMNQQMMAHANISLPYSSQNNNISNILGPSLNISPDAFQRSLIASESNISSLLNNSELQIQPLPSKHSDIAFNSFENQELNLGASYEENSSLGTQDYSNNFDDSNKGSLCEDLNFENLHNISDEPASLTEHSESTEKWHTPENGDKDLQQTKDPNQNSSAIGINSEENLSYQSETEDISSEAFWENCTCELDAVSILAVVDLERNPKWAINRKIEFNKKEYERLKNAETLNDEVKLGLKRVELNEKAFEIARTLLNRYGSFTKLSDAMLRKARLLQIKKELNAEHEERTSCQFAQKGQIQPLLNQDDPTGIKDTQTTGSQNPCGFESQSSESINHIEKIQTQIQAIQENPLVDGTAHLGVVHHFPTPGMSTASNVAMSITPRTEMMNEFRETPSRGSGPRTPARPESAMSQNDESILTPLQVKKERLEACNSASPLSQNTFPQNNSPLLSVSIPNASQLASPMNNPAYTMTPTNTQAVNTLNSQRLQSIAPNVSINNSNPQIQNMMQFQQMQGGPPNVTVPFPTNSNFSKVLVNIASKTQPPPSAVTPAMTPNNPNANVVLRNAPFYNVQQVFIPGTNNVSPRFVQSSAANINNNMNTFNLYKQAMTSGGTMLVNSIGQSTYSIPTNVATPVLNHQQVTQVCNSNNYQQTMQHIPSPVNQSTSNAAVLMPSNKPEDSTLQMSCAVCKKAATLRCKQCAKVAYCNTTCAKNYWHSRHKMECKLMSG